MALFGILLQVKSSYFDLIDENDNLIGKTASFDEVHNQGLWHRGVHVLIYTPDGQIVMQKRSLSMKYHPDEIEVSVGGGVDRGETPLEAAIREVHEELNIRIKKKDIKLIGKSKFNHRTKTQINRVFQYSYSVCVPKDQIDLNINTIETNKVFLVTKRKLRFALRAHRIKNIGKITPTYAYWKYLIDSI